jgi:hypothetical protein
MRIIVNLKAGHNLDEVASGGERRAEKKERKKKKKRWHV